jgi:RNA polymerase sigma factor (sigma-70 family)
VGREDIRHARLVEAVRDGEARAFELLYERHHGPILSFCRHLTGRLEDAEDAVQHTFLSAYREITGSADELDLKPWLYTVARNRCLSLLRSRRVREGSAAGALWTGRHGPPEEHGVEAWGMEGLAEEVERREELRALVADLGQLPEPQRAALVLSELEALSHAQIAQVLDVDTAKVRSLVFQARDSLISTRDARNTPCGEIRFQLSTLTGSSLRRRTLRRHVRGCVGCREFEVALRGQHRDFALILPVTAGVGLRGTALGGGTAGGGVAAAGGLAAGGAALAGGGAAVGGGGVFGGLVAALSGSGVAQLTAVVAIAATGTAGVAKAGVAERLGIVDGGQVVERRSDPRSKDTPSVLTPVAGDPEHREAGGPGPGLGGGPGGGKDGAEPRDGAGGGSHGRGKPNGDVPPGLAKENGGVPPGLAQKGDNWTPPGQAGKGGAGPPGQARKAEGGTPPGQARKSGGGTPPGQANKDGADAPAGGGGNDRPKPTPPGQDKKPGRESGEQPAGAKPEQPANVKPEQAPKTTPPGQAKDPKPK